MTYPALSLIGVSKRYRAGVPGCSASVDVLRAVDLRVDAGEIVGLVGPTGAGKSTLLLCAAGLLHPDSGTVMWFGNAARSGLSLCTVALVPGHAVRQPCLTIREMLHSCGPPPRLLLLDDTLDADSIASAALRALIRALAARGTAVVITSRLASTLAGVATRCAVLAEGVVSSDQRRNRSAARVHSSSRSARARSSMRSTNGRSLRSPQ